jgi:hypothetical protein
MTKMILALALIGGASLANAETIILAPGETVSNGISKITCSAPVVAPDTAPVCGLAGAGAYNGNTWAHRVTVDGVIVSATDSFPTAVESITKLRQTGLCGTRTLGACQLLGAGAYNGNSWSQRIAVGPAKTIVLATDSQATAFQMVADLRKAGICN